MVKYWLDHSKAGRKKISEKMFFSDDLWEIVGEMYKYLKDSDLLTDFFSLDKEMNDYGITLMDVGGSDGHVNLTVKRIDATGKETFEKETALIFYLFKAFLPKYKNDEVNEFIRTYNSLRNGKIPTKEIEIKSEYQRKQDNINNRYSGNYTSEYNYPNTYRGGSSYQSPAVVKIDPKDFIVVSDLSFKPKDPRHTFLTLTTETYPHGHEEEVMKYLPTSELTKDEWGNYYKIIGKSETMFTSHLDTVGIKHKKVNILSKIEDGDEILYTDGLTILGADDKGGLTCLLYMMAFNIPGIYYFFLGEERGGIGSGHVSDNFSKIPHLKGVKRCISFDRRDVHSVITKQSSNQCCSDEFGDALCAALNQHGHKMRLDPTGSFTDSANFIDLIPECTNVSVGYKNEHTGRELQNMSFLDRLCKSLIKIDWENLPVERSVAGFDTKIMEEYGEMLIELDGMHFNNDIKPKSNKNYSSLDMTMSDNYFTLEIEDGLNDLIKLQKVFKKYKMDPFVYFDYDIIKIELK